MNAATEKVTGRSREELIGTDFSDYFTDPEKARAGYQQVSEGSVMDYALESGTKTDILPPCCTMPRYTATMPEMS